MLNGSSAQCVWIWQRLSDRPVDPDQSELAGDTDPTVTAAPAAPAAPAAALLLGLIKQDPENRYPCEHLWTKKQTININQHTTKKHTWSKSQKTETWQHVIVIYCYMQYLCEHLWTKNTQKRTKDIWLMCTIMRFQIWTYTVYDLENCKLFSTNPLIVQTSRQISYISKSLKGVII